METKEQYMESNKEVVSEKINAIDKLLAKISN